MQVCARKKNIRYCQNFRKFQAGCLKSGVISSEVLKNTVQILMVNLIMERLFFRLASVLGQFQKTDFHPVNGKFAPLIVPLFIQIAFLFHPPPPFLLIYGMQTYDWCNKIIQQNNSYTESMSQSIELRI